MEPVIDTLAEMGFVKDIVGRDGIVHQRKIDDFLLPGIHHPPTDKASKNAVATIPQFQLTLESQTNVQICASQGAICYVTKYVTKKEEGRQCLTKADKKHNILINALDHYDVGRSSVKIAIDKLIAQKGQGPAIGREVSSPQMSMHVLDIPYHITNVKFIFCSTLPLEFRRAGLKTAAGSKVLDPHYNLIPVIKRAALNDPERQFSPNQQIQIRDFAETPFTVDTTTSYSLRPPELLQFIG